MEILDFLKVYAPIISAGVAISNLALLFFVFKFNRKSSYSKLSVSAFSVSKNQLDNLKFDPSYFIEEFNEGHLKRGARSSDFEKLRTEYLLVKLENTGDSVLTNIKVNLILKGYGMKVVVGSDEEEILSQERIKMFTFPFDVELPYLGAGDTYTFSLITLSRHFSETELILSKIIVNKHNYFKENTSKKNYMPAIIHRYFNPFLEKAKKSSKLSDHDGGYPIEIHKEVRSD